ncbi:MAG: response regulator [Bryobacteraceae bacterium]
MAIIQRNFQRLQASVLPELAALSPAEQLAARALSSVLITLLVWLALWFALALPFFVVRKLPTALMNGAVAASFLISLALLKRARVKPAIWVFTITLWIDAGVIALLSGGIRSVAMLSFVPGFVTAATLLGAYVATVSCGIFLIFALALAILDMAGVRFPVYFPFPPMTIWMGALATAVIVAMPLNQLLSFLRNSVAVMQRQLEELRNSGQTLRESEARLRAILESARDGVIVADAGSGKILSVNPAAEALAGGQVQQLQKILEGAFERTTGGPAPGPEEPDRTPPLIEAVVVHDNGTRTPVEFSSNVFHKDGRRLLVGVFRDISERKNADQERLKLVEQLLQAQKLETVGRLAGGVAHDFNNLLTVINGFSDLALGRITPEDENWLPLDQIRKAGERAATLTQQLLVFSRKQISQPKPIDLNVVLSEIRPMLQSLLNEDIELLIRTHSPVPIIAADLNQIHQVVMNLAANARDAMANGGKLILETGTVEFTTVNTMAKPAVPAGLYAMLCVSDTGTGMSEEVLSHLFEPFFTTKEAGKGTGLGLSTVYGIVRQNQGGVAVESTPGNGSTFRVYLPVSARAARPRPPEPKPQDPHRKLETILVVEDQDSVRKLAVEILRSHGYRVLEACDGYDALAVAERHPESIELMVTDVVMPSMNGPELAQRMRAVRPKAQVMFMSGYSEDVIAHHGALDAGIAYLPKPFTPAGLIQKVQEVLVGAGQG